MERREFLRNSTLASSLLFVPSFVRAFENIPSNLLGHKKLVVIQLSGGNDGLNTVIPYRNDLYYKNRPQIAINKNKILNLNGELGLHPSLTGFKELYDEGYLSIINNVGYPNPVRSHFRSADIWQTASGSNDFKSTGWIGRYMDQYAKDAHIAIDVDDKLSLALKGATKSGIATTDYRKLYKNASDPFFNKLQEQKHMDEHLNEENLGYLYKQMIQATSSSSYIYEKANVYKSKIKYANNSFGKQLESAAQFINSHLDTKVLYASMKGFDTHYNQQSRHQKLMSELGNGVNTFVNDLKRHDTFKDTLILIFSEFGRRVEENASGGTDHGAANNVFVLNENLNKPGIYNSSADLSELDNNGDIKFKVDFRHIYASILENWLEADSKLILGEKFKPLSFI